MGEEWMGRPRLNLEVFRKIFFCNALIQWGEQAPTPTGRGPWVLRFLYFEGRKKRRGSGGVGTAERS